MPQEEHIMSVTVVNVGPGQESRSVEVAAPAAELFAIVATRAVTTN